MLVATTMCKLMCALLIGVYLSKKGIFTKETNKSISDFISVITNPCLIVYSLSTITNADTDSVFRLFVGGLIAYAMFFILGWVFTRVFKVEKDLRGVYICMLMFSNYGFMGFPVVQSLFGDSAIFYLSIFNMPYNFLIYTLGMLLISKDASITGDIKTSFRFNQKDLFSIGSVASVITLIIFFAKLKVPQIIYDCTGFIGNVTMPLAMVVIGARMATSSLTEVKNEKSIVPLTIARLAFLPVVTWAFMHLVTDDPNIIRICTVGAGMPVGALTSMLSAPMPKQNRSASICVALTTILSMATIPILALIIGV